MAATVSAEDRRRAGSDRQCRAERQVTGTVRDRAEAHRVPLPRLRPAGGLPRDAIRRRRELWPKGSPVELDGEALPCRSCKELYVEDVVCGGQVLTLATSDFTPNEPSCGGVQGVSAEQGGWDAQDSADTVRNNVTIDWTLRENVRSGRWSSASCANTATPPTSRRRQPSPFLSRLRSCLKAGRPPEFAVQKRRPQRPRPGTSRR